MKQCLGGRLTQLVHENGRTSHPRPRITSDVWRTMLECQVNLSVDVHMRMPQQIKKHLCRSAQFVSQGVAWFRQEATEAPVVGLMMVNDSLLRSIRGWCSVGRSAVLQRAPSCCWQGFNQRKDKHILFLANCCLLPLKTLGLLHHASVCS